MEVEKNMLLYVGHVLNLAAKEGLKIIIEPLKPLSDIPNNNVDHFLANNSDKVRLIFLFNFIFMYKRKV